MSQKKFEDFYKKHFSTKTKMTDFILKQIKAENIPEIRSLFLKTISIDFPTEEISFMDFTKNISKVLSIDLNSEIFIRSLINLHSNNRIISVTDIEEILKKLNYDFNGNKLVIFHKFLFTDKYLVDSQQFLKTIEAAVETSNFE
ncbi:hypothetical protein [Carp edema virus]|nr:hypothetical protein [Carp edema virus]